MKVPWYHGMGSNLRLRWHGQKTIHNASRYGVLTYMPVKNYTCNGHKRVKASARVYKKGPYMTTILVQNNWKQLVKIPSYRIDHDNYIQRKLCGGRWDIRRNVRCRPNIHISTTTPMRVNTSFNTGQREWKSSTNGIEGGIWPLLNLWERRGYVVPSSLTLGSY